MAKTIIGFYLYIVTSCGFSQKIFLFLLSKNEESPTFKAFFWPLKLIKTLFTYLNHKINPKPSPDGTLSPNTIFFSEGLYCTVLYLEHALACLLHSVSKIEYPVLSRYSILKVSIDLHQLDSALSNLTFWNFDSVW